MIPYDSIVDSPLGLQTLASFTAATTAASRANKIRQATYYLTFAVYYDTQVLSPSIPEAAMFQQFLAAPGSRRNYLSGAKRWILSRGGDDSALSSNEAHDVYKGDTL